MTTLSRIVNVAHTHRPHPCRVPLGTYLDVLAKRSSPAFDRLPEWFLDSMMGIDAGT